MFIIVKLNYFHNLAIKKNTTLLFIMKCISNHLSLTEVNQANLACLVVLKYKTHPWRQRIQFKKSRLIPYGLNLNGALV